MQISHLIKLLGMEDANQTLNENTGNEIRPYISKFLIILRGWPLNLGRETISHLGWVPVWREESLEWGLSMKTSWVTLLFHLGFMTSWVTLFGDSKFLMDWKNDKCQITNLDLEPIIHSFRDKNSVSFHLFFTHSKNSTQKQRIFVTQCSEMEHWNEDH